MRSWQILALVAAVASWTNEGYTQPNSTQRPLTLTSALSGAPTQPPSRFPITPQAGEWLICVQTFKDNRESDRGTARNLAEAMVEVLMHEYKLNAYIHDRASKARSEEQARVQKIRDQHWDNLDKLRAQGIEAVDERLRYRTVEIPDEFAVLVGEPNRPFKDMDAAREFLDKVRKMKPPPEQFSSRGIFADDEPGSKKLKTNGSAVFNPFKTAMVVHNPSVPFKSDQADPEKADDFLKQMNSQESLSVLKCSKPWTLVVKIYQGQVVNQAPTSPSIMQRIGLAKKEPEILNASAAQAHSTAEFLRKMNPSFEAYVMHQRSYSLVTVGNYEGPNDPNLLAAQKTLAGMQLKNAGTGIALETLNAQPLPMKIPR